MSRQGADPGSLAPLLERFQLPAFVSKGNDPSLSADQPTREPLTINWSAWIPP